MQDRRKIEADLFGGKLRGVAATNALELGIDVGHIDATLHLGFPGSIARLVKNDAFNEVLCLSCHPAKILKFLLQLVAAGWKVWKKSKTIISHLCCL